MTEKIQTDHEDKNLENVDEGNTISGDVRHFNRGGSLYDTMHKVLGKPDNKIPRMFAAYQAGLRLGKH